MNFVLILVQHITKNSIYLNDTVFSFFAEDSFLRRKLPRNDGDEE